jgi:uncharacterized membrane protein (DUF106 family)
MNDAVRERLESDDALAAAAEEVLDAAERGDGVVTWADVSDAVPADLWGRLLETGLLVPTDDGFVVDDPDAARSLLADRAVDADALAGDRADSDADAGWSTADKLAGVCALGLMASYQIPGGQATIGSTVHHVLGPVEAALPFGAVVAVLALATTLVGMTLRRRLANTERREQLKSRTEAIQERLSAARERGDEAAVEHLQERQRELMREQLSLFKTMLRPMVWAMLVTVPVFLWLSWLTVAPAAAITPAAQILPLAGRIVWTARLVGPLQVWTVWYIACSIVSGLAARRAADRVDRVLA